MVVDIFKAFNKWRKPAVKPDPDGDAKFVANYKKATLMEKLPELKDMTNLEIVMFLRELSELGDVIGKPDYLDFDCVKICGVLETLGFKQVTTRDPVPDPADIEQSARFLIGEALSQLERNEFPYPVVFIPRADKLLGEKPADKPKPLEPV